MEGERPVVLTAGYGNRGFLPFVELLKGLEVTHVVDVRSVPESSYWEEFRRRNLEFLIPEQGLRYVYMGDTLGGVASSPILCKDPGAVPIEGLDRTPEFRLGLSRLVQAASDSSKKIVLMCGCLRPHGCHRARLVAPAAIAAGLDVRHVDAKGAVVTHADVADEIAVQGRLF